MKIANNEGVSLRENGDQVEVLVNGVPILNINDDGVAMLDARALQGQIAIEEPTGEVQLFTNQRDPDDDDDDDDDETPSGYWLDFSEDVLYLLYGEYYVLGLFNSGFERVGGLDGAAELGYVPFAVGPDGGAVVK